jgi:hypothetical protein
MVEFVSMFVFSALAAFHSQAKGIQGELVWSVCFNQLNGLSSRFHL